MRIAAVIPGRITYNPDSFDFLHRISEKNDLTFFFSVNLPHINEALQRFIDEFKIHESQYNVEQTIFPEFFERLTQQQQNFIKENVVNIKNVYSHHYHSKRCLDCITQYEEKNNIVFDGILKLRPEILSNETFTIDCLDNNICYIPDCYDWLGGINDNIAYGNKDTMRKYLTLVDFMEHYASQRWNFHPESLLRQHLSSRGVEVRRFAFPYTLDMSRFNQESSSTWLQPVV